MSEKTSQKNSFAGVGYWVMTIFGVGLALYVLGFAGLVLFPQTFSVVSAMGLTSEVLDIIYYPILRLLKMP